MGWREASGIATGPPLSAAPASRRDLQQNRPGRVTCCEDPRGGANVFSQARFPLEPGVFIDVEQVVPFRATVPFSVS